VAPVNETDMVLLPEGLKALKKVAKEVGLDLRGAYLNLDGGFDSRHNRKLIFNAGMMPNIKENPRNRKTTKRGRKRLFNEAIHALRMRVERTFAWEDKFKRLIGYSPNPILFNRSVLLAVAAQCSLRVIP
jgi:hypothetical protein